MEDILLAPPIAFGIYLVLTGVLSGFGRALAGPASEASEAKLSTYASGEPPSVCAAVPGYTHFCAIDLCIAARPLCGLMHRCCHLPGAAAANRVGLSLALLALSLGSR